MKYIIHPVFGYKYLLASNNGRKLLKQYVKYYQQGGMTIKLSRDSFKHLTDFGGDKCLINSINWVGVPEDIIKLLVDEYNKEGSHNVNMDIALDLLDDWVDKKLTNPNDPSHNRLIPGKIEDFYYEEIVRTDDSSDGDNDDPAMETIKESLGYKNMQKYYNFDICTRYEQNVIKVNKLYSYVKPLTAVLICFGWYGLERGHATCIGRDGRNEPFSIELQPVQGECQHIPYGWDNIIKFFEYAIDIRVILGGPNLKPIRKEEEEEEEEEASSDRQYM